MNEMYYIHAIHYSTTAKRSLNIDIDIKSDAEKEKQDGD